MHSNLPLPAEEKVQEVMEDLDYFEGWCARTNTALSALGRTALHGDQAALYRWRERGSRAVTEEKRRNLAIYVLQHPDGIPGYKRAKTGKKGGRNATFTPGGNTPTGSTAGYLGAPGHSTDIPVPGPSTLESDDLQYAKQKAFSTGQPLARILAEFVSLGIRCDREAAYEE